MKILRPSDGTAKDLPAIESIDTEPGRQRIKNKAHRSCDRRDGKFEPLYPPYLQRVYCITRPQTPIDASSSQPKATAAFPKLGNRRQNRSRHQGETVLVHSSPPTPSRGRSPPVHGTGTIPVPSSIGTAQELLVDSNDKLLLPSRLTATIGSGQDTPFSTLPFSIGSPI